MNYHFKSSRTSKYSDKILKQNIAQRVDNLVEEAVRKNPYDHKKSTDDVIEFTKGDDTPIKEVQITKRTMINWKNEFPITKMILARIAETFDVSIDYLVGFTDTKTPVNSILRKLRDTENALSKKLIKTPFFSISFLLLAIILYLPMLQSISFMPKYEMITLWYFIPSLQIVTLVINKIYGRSSLTALDFVQFFFAVGILVLTIVNASFRTWMFSNNMIQQIVCLLFYGMNVLFLSKNIIDFIAIIIQKKTISYSD